MEFAFVPVKVGRRQRQVIDCLLNLGKIPVKAKAVGESVSEKPVVERSRCNLQSEKGNTQNHDELNQEARAKQELGQMQRNGARRVLEVYSRFH